MEGTEQKIPVAGPWLDPELDGVPHDERHEEDRAAEAAAAEPDAPVDDSGPAPIEQPAREYPGVCTHCGEDVPHASIVRKRDRLIHMKPRTDARSGQPRPGQPLACGPVRTRWCYWISCAWEHEGRMGFASNQVNMRVPIRHGTELRELEGLIGLTLMKERHLSALPKVTLIGFDELNDPRVQ